MKITRSMLKPFPAEIPGTPEQWEEIAKAYETKPLVRNFHHREMTSSGICWAIWFWARGSFTDTMVRWVCEIHPYRTNFWFPRNRSGDLKRAQVARLIADELRRRVK